MLDDPLDLDLKKGEEDMMFWIIIGIAYLIGFLTGASAMYYWMFHIIVSKGWKIHNPRAGRDGRPMKAKKPKRRAETPEAYEKD